MLKNIHSTGTARWFRVIASWLDTGEPSPRSLGITALGITCFELTAQYKNETWTTHKESLLSQALRDIPLTR